MASSGDFLDGAIGDWFEDNWAVVAPCPARWRSWLVDGRLRIALLLARAIPDRIVGLVGIAAAPDFTEDSMWATFTAAQRADIMAKGQIGLPSDYADSPISSPVV